jgi:hypothetical protein
MELTRCVNLDPPERTNKQTNKQEGKQASIRTNEKRNELKRTKHLTPKDLMNEQVND